jgi:DNA-directed RNA polymerase alpha subunit
VRLAPREAFEEAAAILVNQYTALAGSTQSKLHLHLVAPEEEEKNELNKPIEELELSVHVPQTRLINNDIRTVHDLVTLSEQDLRELKGFGSASALDEVKDKLAELEF